MTPNDPISPIGSTGPVELRGTAGGLTFVPASAPLIGLNYYDGRFLRADDLNLERRGQRAYVEFSNQAGGPGVAWGFELSGLGTATLGLAPGLGIAPKGQVLYLPTGVQAEMAKLITAPPAPASAPAAGVGFAPCVTEPAAATAAVVPGIGLYLVCLAAGSGLCGHTEVLGRLCESGCVTAADRPYVVDGVTLLLRPLTLDVRPFTAAGVTRTEVHLRSQVASAYFAQERAAAGSRLSAAGLGAGLWGAGATPLAGEDIVPVGVLGWDGSRIKLLDLWTARRERMETPSRAYWAGRVEQRPWPVFLAQVLQFQSQLAQSSAAAATIPARILVERGFVELPSAGYLPVDQQSDLRGQVQDLMGPGVELRLCAVRRDQIPHELERAQHMNRISLLNGLADAAAREQVDILVPDGTTVPTGQQRTGIGFAVDLAVGPEARQVIEPGAVTDTGTLAWIGAGRVDFDRAINARLAVATSAQQGVKAVLDLLTPVLDPDSGVAEFSERLGAMRFGPAGGPSVSLLRATAAAVQARVVRHRAEGQKGDVVTLPGRSPQVVALLLALAVEKDPFALPNGGRTHFELSLAAFLPRTQPVSADGVLEGFLRRLDGDPTKVELDVKAFLTLHETGLTIDDATRAVQGVVVLSRGKQEDGYHFLEVSDKDTTVVARVAWRGDPIEAVGTLVTRQHSQDGNGGNGGNDAAGGEQPVAAFRALEDADLGSPGGRYHDAADDALTILGGSHAQNRTYAQDQYRLLFPPAAVLTSQVQAATDWVLFRRRRREECEGTVVQPAPVDRVTAWVLRADSAGEAEGAIAGIKKGDGHWPPAESWSRVDVVFEAGVTTLLTPPATWQTCYRTAGGGSLIALAGYAGAVGAPAATVGIGRLDALLAAVAPAAVPDPDVWKDGVGGMPDGLVPAPGTDGSAFLVTYDPDLEAAPDRLGVLALVLEGESAQLGEKIEQGEASAVSGVEFASLGEPAAGETELEPIAVEAGQWLASKGIGANRSVSAVAWTHTALDPAVTSSLLELVERVVDKLRAQPEVADLTPATHRVVDYERGDEDPAARLFLLVTPIRIG